MIDGIYCDEESCIEAAVRRLWWGVLRAFGFQQVGPLGVGPWRYVGMPLLKKLRAAACSHEFRLADLKATGIEAPPAPASDAGLEVHFRYLHDMANHPSHTRRVVWPCAKCGRVFTDHCGLDISPAHGPIVLPKEGAS